jgi:23S rRNA (uracil1939-C5)-methyltransferase
VPHQKLHLPAVWHLVPIGSFLQVNQAINLRLVSDLVTSALARGLSTFCDLYAGSGNFTLPLLASGLVGHAVEVDPDAGRAAALAAKGQNLPSARFAIGDAGSLAESSASSGQSFDLVVVDPPRAGIRQALPSMAAITRKHFVYCSCNLDTLARDLGHLCRARFELESITLYDMFPGTSHVECVVWLRAPERAAR